MTGWSRLLVVSLGNPGDQPRLDHTLRREGAVTTAYMSTSGFGRIKTFALAGTLALGMLFPGIPGVLADDAGAPATTAVGDGFDITISSPEDLVGRTAYVNTGGDNANLRAEASLSADILLKVPHGSIVNLRIDVADTVYDADGVTRWWPVSYDGTDGWMSGEYLAESLTDASTPTETPVPTTASGDPSNQFVFKGQVERDSVAKVSGNGENINIRQEPNNSSPVVEKALDGDIITFRLLDADSTLDADGVTRWWPVTYKGVDGWILGIYLVPADDSSNPVTGSTPAAGETPATGEETPEATATPSSGNAFQAGDFAAAQSGSNVGVNIRISSTKESAEIGFVPEGAVVEIVRGPVGFDNSTNGWYEVTYEGTTGFVDGDLLVLTERPVTETPTPTEAPTEGATETPEGTTTPTPRATTTPEPGETPTPSSGNGDVPAFAYPLDSYQRTQGFGCSNLGFYAFNPDFGCAIHDGLDLHAPSGTPLKAAAAGTVTQAGWCNCGLGYRVEIDHGNGVVTIYGHMRTQPSVTVGQKVNQGDVIGEVGSTGVSTGPHVHFVVKINGRSVDPEDYLPSN